MILKWPIFEKHNFVDSVQKIDFVCLYKKKRKKKLKIRIGTKIKESRF